MVQLTVRQNSVGSSQDTHRWHTPPVIRKETDNCNFFQTFDDDLSQQSHETWIRNTVVHSWKPGCPENLAGDEALIFLSTWCEEVCWIQDAVPPLRQPDNTNLVYVYSYRTAVQIPNSNKFQQILKLQKLHKF